MNKPIYLDNNATTPVDPQVLEAMLPYLRESFGNASSTTHSYGWESSHAVEKARKQVAALIGCHDKPQTVIWTSGATESNNMALQGLLKPYLLRKEKTHLITSQVEHKAILDVAHHLEQLGAEVTYLAPDRFGQISAAQVKSAVQPHTRLISIIMGQNEIGTLNPVHEIGLVAHEFKIPFHVDAAQTVGKLPIDVNEIHIDLLSASGHKFYAPKGVGFLYVRENIELEPLFFGGSQERNHRPGTLNVPGIVAIGTACEIASQNMTEESKRLTQFRDYLIKRILAEVPQARLNGHPTERLSTNISFSFEGLTADIFALKLSGLAVSSTSACSTGSGSPSHVLAAIGLSDSLAKSTLRVGIGRFTTQQEIEIAAQKIIGAVLQN